MPVRDTVLDWIVRKDTSYLIGAGCSACAEKPLIYRLTKLAVASLEERSQRLFGQLLPQNGRDPHIEDFMNLLQRLLLLTQSSTILPLPDIDAAGLTRIIAEVKQAIVDTIGTDWIGCNHHQRFLSRIVSPSRPRDLFVLNYDTVIEASLEAARLPYVDGFRGANRAYFDPSVFDQATSISGMFRLHKLHGSINWVRQDDGIVLRVADANAQEEGQRLVVYPSEQKYVQTQYGVYETMMQRFRACMRSPSRNNTLVCLGYSFNDEHINEAIVDAATDNATNLTVVAFLGPEDANLPAQQARLESLASRCRANMNFYVGNRFFVGDALSAEESEELLALGLWEFETLVSTISGDGHA